MQPFDFQGKSALIQNVRNNYSMWSQLRWRHVRRALQRRQSDHPTLRQMVWLGSERCPELSFVLMVAEPGDLPGGLGQVSETLRRNVVGDGLRNIRERNAQVVQAIIDSTHRATCPRERTGASIP
jgi:hypothetical protein